MDLFNKIAVVNSIVPHIGSSNSFKDITLMKLRRYTINV